MDVGFGEALLYSGALLAVAAALSGLMRGTVLSISVLSVAAGLILAEAGAIHVDGSDTAVVNLFLLALIVTLFSDGLFVERELLVLHWGPVVRALLIALPLTLVLLALAAKLLFSELGWAEAFLLGLGSLRYGPCGDVRGRHVAAGARLGAARAQPGVGLNDGLALPFVLFFIILASPGGDAGNEAAKLVGEAAFGAVLGVLLGLGAGRLTHHLPGGGIVRRYEGIYALGVGLLAYGIADVTFGQRIDRRLRLRDLAGGGGSRHRRRLRRLQRERQLDPPGADLLRLRRADRRHGVRRAPSLCWSPSSPSRS